MPLTLLNLKRKVNVLLDTPNSLPFGKCKRGNRITKYVSTQCLPKHCSWSSPPQFPLSSLYCSDHVKKDRQQQQRKRESETQGKYSQVPKEVEKTSPFRFVCLQRHPPPPPSTAQLPTFFPVPFVDGPSLDAYRAVRRRACQYSLFICISSSWHIDLSNNFWYIYQFLLPTYGKIALFLLLLYIFTIPYMFILMCIYSRYFFNCIFE